MPDDPWFEEVDPLLEAWLYESWCQDLQDQNDFAKAYAILEGSFVNPDMARAMMKNDNPDYSTSDEEFEESTRMVLEDRNRAGSRQEKKPRRRKRRRHRKCVID